MKLKTALLASFGVAASVVGASAVEEPPHQVVSRDGDFEIRDYPSMTVAETTVDADRNSAAYAGFRRLAGYIFGGNAKKLKIDMTAPVIEARSEYMSCDASTGVEVGHPLRDAARVFGGEPTETRQRTGSCCARSRPPTWLSSSSRVWPATMLSPQGRPNFRRC